MKFHPQPGRHGEPVAIHHPSQPTALDAWSDPTQLATVVPDGPLPAALAGIALQAWTDAPQDAAGWEAIASQSKFVEPPFSPPAALKASAGAVILEPDGRVWLVSPSNRFGGYDNTFPKGRVDPRTSLRANALREAFEESGLKVALTGFLVDCRRSTTYTRYYLGHRTGGHPGAMGWESQAVRLVPRPMLPALANSPADAPILAALEAHLATCDLGT